MLPIHQALELSSGARAMAEEKGGASTVHTELWRHAKSLGRTNKGIIGIVLVLNA